MNGFLIGSVKDCALKSQTKCEILKAQILTGIRQYIKEESSGSLKCYFG